MLKMSKNIVLLQIFLFICNYKRSAAALPPSVRIIGGQPANDISMPYIASLVTFGQHICGGSIINERTIVTAAHCLVKTPAFLLRAHVGAKTRSLRDGALFSVAATHFHMGYSATTMDYDIGLVRLLFPLRYMQTIQPIRLPARDFQMRDGDNAIVAGWGYQSPNGPGAEILHYASVPLVNQRTCNRLLFGAITQRMICAGFQKGGVDACQMDSGGPLVLENRLIGIVSWGVGCGLPDKPGVYARVTELLPWIAEIMAKNYNEQL